MTLMNGGGGGGGGKGGGVQFNLVLPSMKRSL